MLPRIAAIAFNTYREAVRAWVLHGLLALALATTAYSLVLGTLSLHQDMRVVADIGSSSASFFAVVVAVVLGATSLYREVEMKNVFPILTRRLRRHEYVVGKYLGMLLTVGVYLALDGAFMLFILAAQARRPPLLVGGAAVVLFAVLAVLLVRAKYTRAYVIVPWALVAVLVAFVLAAPAGGERRLVVSSLVLAFGEAGIVTAVALVFSAFSSPFLTAVLTFLVFLIGRSADTLANLPPRFLGEGGRTAGRVLARVFPNLHMYVPPRPVLLGEVDKLPLLPYVGRAMAIAGFYAAVLLVAASLIFRKRDFQ